VRSTPARRHGVEILDDPTTPIDVRIRAMADIARANNLFGGTRSMLQALCEVYPRLPRNALLVDIGAGLADIPAEARAAAGQRGITLTIVGVDVSEPVLRASRGRIDAVVAADALRLPLSDNSADVVTCSQLLHHFVDTDARAVIAELHRVSRGWVVVSDLRRSWLAAAGFWLASVLLRFHPVTRHDGVISVLRGFTFTELAAMAFGVTGVTPTLQRGAFWRLSATWNKQGTM
jgi:SAM-dependent methyltransferase